MSSVVSSLIQMVTNRKCRSGKYIGQVHTWSRGWACRPMQNEKCMRTHLDRTNDIQVERCVILIRAVRKALLPGVFWRLRQRERIRPVDFIASPNEIDQSMMAQSRWLGHHAITWRSYLLKGLLWAYSRLKI